jgi:hypothetical protein
VKLNHGLRKVTIAPTDEAQGKATNNAPRSIQRKLHDEKYDDPHLAQWLDHQAIVTLAGVAAQRRAFPRMRWRRGYGDDSSQPLVTQGSDAQIVSRLVYNRYGEGKLADSYFAYLRERTEALVNQHWQAIERVVAALLERKTLSADEARLAMLDPAMKLSLAACWPVERQRKKKRAA